MNFLPYYNRVLVKPIEPEEKKGGIIVPEQAKEKPVRGRVVAVGKGSYDETGKRIPMETKIGVTVLYGKYAGSEVEVGGVLHVCLREDEIHGAFEE